MAQSVMLKCICFILFVLPLVVLAAPTDYNNLSSTPKAPAKANCTDGLKNGNETDIDCGGNCSPCSTAGQGCLVTRDCSSMFCNEERFCESYRSNGLPCSAPNECLSYICSNGTCSDPLPSGSHCDAATDCDSGVCTELICRDPTCHDGEANGDETDVDCGTSCPKCQVTQLCQVDKDCDTGYCGQFTWDSAGHLTDLRCLKPICTDGVENGDETDVDCGGSCDSCPAKESNTTLIIIVVCSVGGFALLVVLLLSAYYRKILVEEHMLDERAMKEKKITELQEKLDHLGEDLSEIKLFASSTPSA
eukprot:TRINITY_DN5569_c0_g1::TRINITY_DN5569_c0_g1_i1::g.9344::m.9344 TRINITY_DN5569_c0_g1::TRINITY_DN5569_c0_g1_i1::g.9344  ORF type:complete len:334 (-),score=34.82,CD34_antigen/PF06365.7/0.12,DUF2762/PF10960.3/0.23 TRINITY_DN5569_c0_g1_i1:251-1165(-)